MWLQAQKQTYATYDRPDIQEPIQYIDMLEEAENSFAEESDLRAVGCIHSAIGSLLQAELKIPPKWDKRLGWRNLGVKELLTKATGLDPTLKDRIEEFSKNRALLMQPKLSSSPLSNTSEIGEHRSESPAGVLNPPACGDFRDGTPRLVQEGMLCFYELLDFFMKNRKQSIV